MGMRTVRPLIAAVVGSMLIAASLPGASAGASDPPPLDWQLTSTVTTADEVTVTWETAETTLAPYGGEELIDPVPVFRPNVINDSSDTRYFAFGTEFRTQGIIEPLWTPDPWGAFSDAGLIEPFWFALPPGASYAVDIHNSSAGIWYDGMPSWSGHTITVFELDGPAADVDGVPVSPSPQAAALSSITTPGGFVPADLTNGDTENLSAVLGQRLTVSGGGSTPVLFPGLAASATATGLTPGLALELWAVKNFNYAYFQLLGGGLPVGSIRVGTGTVGSDGTLHAFFVLPSGIPLDGAPGAPMPTGYQMVAGAPGERYWPAGTHDDFIVNPAPPSPSISTSGTATGTADLGATQLSLTFADPAASGSTTITTTSTGPTPTGFALASDPRLYYQLSTDVTFSGTVTVCISYAAGTLPAPPRLFHFDTTALAWSDVTISAVDGEVCGQTTSFSPFVLGYPLFSFSGFLAPVSAAGPNLAKAGQAIPVSFSLGGDEGLGIVSSAQFRVEGTVSNPTGTAIDTVTAGRSSLSYDAASGLYTYVWKTDKAWANRTGDFVLTLSDGSVHTFSVTFKK